MEFCDVEHSMAHNLCVKHTKLHNSLLILSQVKLEWVGVSTQHHNVDDEENILS